MEIIKDKGLFGQKKKLFYSYLPQELPPEGNNLFDESIFKELTSEQHPVKLKYFQELELGRQHLDSSCNNFFRVKGLKGVGKSSYLLQVSSLQKEHNDNFLREIIDNIESSKNTIISALENSHQQLKFDHEQLKTQSEKMTEKIEKLQQVNNELKLVIESHLNYLRKFSIKRVFTIISFIGLFVTTAFSLLSLISGGSLIVTFPMTTIPVFSFLAMFFVSKFLPENK